MQINDNMAKVPSSLLLSLTLYDSVTVHWNRLDETIRNERSHHRVG